jgi:two-component system, LytTR family, sensor kinase
LTLASLITQRKKIMKKKALFLLINSPFWIAALAFVYSIGLHGYYNDPMFASDFSYVVSYSIVMLLNVLIPFYMFYSWLVPKYLFPGKRKRFFWLSAAWIFIGGPLLLNILAEANHYLHMGESIMKFYFEYPRVLPLSYLLWVLYSLIPAFLGIISRLAYVSYSNFEKTRELENRNLQQEIQMIKSKLNPHLFFNTLNNIDTLIKTNPDKASATLARLSDLLRYVVYHNDTEYIPISIEVDNLERFIELEKIRLQKPENVSFYANVFGETKIPPMIFFPFVENGFKHSNLNLPDQNLQIDLFQDNNKISFKCVNTIAEKQTINKSGGVGLELATKRLEMLFSQKHKLDIIQNDNQFSVLLEIYT